MQAQTQVESAVQDAEKACEGGTAGECAAAWDNVEEISAAIAHKKANDVSTISMSMDISQLSSSGCLSPSAVSCFNWMNCWIAGCKQR